MRHVTLKHGFSDRSFRTYNLWAQTGGHGGEMDWWDQRGGSQVDAVEFPLVS